MSVIMLSRFIRIVLENELCVKRVMLSIGVVVWS